ncbi:MAG: hypothetical protein K2J84_08410 [Bacteroidaceae bacterium]|nr:hypothetical protein [Bacteroidaceae bacterium]
MEYIEWIFSGIGIVGFMGITGGYIGYKIGIRNTIRKLEMKREKHNTIVCWFCLVFIATLVILIGYLSCSYNAFKDSQEKIVNEHVKHIVKVDSIFYDMKTIVLSTDSGTIVNAQTLLSQLQNDSALFKREILLSQEEMNNLITLHINKIDNEYSQIGIWGGLLSIVFLIFGFFAIFKIEEIKTEARNVLDEVEKKGKEAMETVQGLQGQASELNKVFNDIRQKNHTFIADKTKEFEDLIESIKGVQTLSEDRLKDIDEHLGKIGSENVQYNTMRNRVTQLEALISMIIEEMLNNNGKEGTDEHSSK